MREVANGLDVHAALQQAKEERTIAGFTD